MTKREWYKLMDEKLDDILDICKQYSEDNPDDTEFGFSAQLLYHGEQKVKVDVGTLAIRFRLAEEAYEETKRHPDYPTYLKIRGRDSM